MKPSKLSIEALIFSLDWICYINCNWVDTRWQ